MAFDVFHSTSLKDTNDVCTLHEGRRDIDVHTDTNADTIMRLKVYPSVLDNSEGMQVRSPSFHQSQFQAEKEAICAVFQSIL